MQSMMGIITGTKSEEPLEEITQHRCMAAVPFGGRYRLIDFVLSNLVNSGIKNVAVITSHNYRALMDHLGSGKEWGLDRKSEGLIILPSASPSVFRRALCFDLKDLYANFDYLEKSKQKYVVLSGNNMVCNINFKEVLAFHQQNTAHVTVVYKEENYTNTDHQDNIFLELEDDNRISYLKKTPNKVGNSNVSLDMLIIERELLKDLIRVALVSGKWDLMDIIAENISEIKVYAYHFNGYLGKINSIESYYRHNMELLNSEISSELFFANGPIYTKIKDGPPARYSGSSNVNNCLVATGCSIEGSVDSSILFRGVSIGSGASVKDCIIMQKSTVEDDVILQNVILDKEVIIRKGTVLKGKDSKPIIIGKKNII